MADTLASLLAILIVGLPLGWAFAASRRTGTVVRSNGHNAWCRCPSCLATARR